MTNLLFCTGSHRDTGRPTEADGDDPGMAKAPHGLLSTISWITKRQFELYFFRYLQSSMNNLLSLSDRGKADVAAALLSVLMLGSIRQLRADEYPTLSSFKRLESALVTYLRVCLQLLPSSIDFWGERGEPVLPITSEDMRRYFVYPEISDAGKSAFISRCYRWADWNGQLGPEGTLSTKSRRQDLGSQTPHVVLRGHLCRQHVFSEIGENSAVIPAHYKATDSMKRAAMTVRSWVKHSKLSQSQSLHDTVELAEIVHYSLLTIGMRQMVVVALAGEGFTQSEFCKDCFSLMVTAMIDIMKHSWWIFRLERILCGSWR